MQRRGTISKLVGAVIAAAALAAPAAADAADWSPPYGLFRSGPVATPLIAPGPGGGASIAWEAIEESAYPRPGTWLTRSIALDGVLGPKRKLLPEGADPDEGSVWTLVGPAGEHIVIWYGSHKSHFGLFAVRRSRDGRTTPVRLVGSPQRIDESWGGPDPDERSAGVGVDVGIDSTGTVTIAWSVIRRSERIDFPKPATLVHAATIHARRLNRDGTLGDSIDVATDGVNRYPRVAVAPAGQTAIAWRAEIGTWVATLDRDGVKTAAQVDTELPADRIPQIAADPHGGFALAWTTRKVVPGAPVPQDVVVARRVGQDGQLSPTYTLTGPGEYRDPRVATDRSGATTVVWVTTERWVESTVQGQRLDPNGGSSQLWTLSGRGAANPELVPHKTAGVMVLWTRYLPSMSNGTSLIETRSLPPGGNPGRIRAVAADHPGTVITNVKLAATGSGNMIALWQRTSQINEPRLMALRASRWVPRCTRPRLVGSAASPPGKRMRGARGARALLRFSRPVSVRVVRATLSYRNERLRIRRPIVVSRTMTTSRTARVFVRVAGRRPPDVDPGVRVVLRLRVRARPYATGCPYGKARTVTIATRLSRFES